MAAPIDVDRLRSLLWQADDDAVYAVLDGAGVPGLLDRLYVEAGPEFACLYRGDLEPDIAEVAPYLVRLAPQLEVFDWIASGWGNAWGIFVVVSADIDTSQLRRHLRKLNLVAGPDGSTLLFRYYDPRTLGAFLGTCDPGQLAEFFGPVRAFFAENPDVGRVGRFACSAGDMLVSQQVLVGDNERSR